MKVGILVKFIVAILFLESCYNPQEGCLDTQASNYAIIADRSCEDCCQYPELMIKMVHMMQDSSFDATDTFVNQMGQRYSIQDVRFYLAGFILKQQDTELKVRETLTPSNANLDITDDVVLWRSVDDKAVIGTVKAHGFFQGLSFNVGIDSVMLNSIYDNIQSGHPLSKEGKLKDIAGIPAWFYIKYVHYKPEPEVVTMYITEPYQKLPYTIDSLVQTSKGSPISYTIKADYSRLLHPVDFNSSFENVKNVVRGNLSEFLIVN